MAERDSHPDEETRPTLFVVPDPTGEQESQPQVFRHGANAPIEDLYGYVTLTDGGSVSGFSCEGDTCTIGIDKSYVGEEPSTTQIGLSAAREVFSSLGDFNGSFASEVNNAIVGGTIFTFRNRIGKEGFEITSLQPTNGTS